MAFFPSRGVNGSTYQTSNGQVYCRTAYGTHKIDNPAGIAVHLLHLWYINAASRRRLNHMLFAVAGLVWGFVVGVLVF